MLVLFGFFFKKPVRICLVSTAGARLCLNNDKAPSAIALAAASANRFRFIVGFICCYKALFAPLKDMTERAVERLQNSRNQAGEWQG